MDNTLSTVVYGSTKRYTTIAFYITVQFTYTQLAVNTLHLQAPG